MSVQSTRTIIALVVAAVLLAFVAWLDNSVMAGAEREATRTFQMGGYALALSVGYVVVVASVVAAAVAARWAMSLWVGIAYMLVGAFFAFLPALYFGPAASENGAAPLLPEPLVRLVADMYSPTGPLNGMTILGAGLLLVGGVTTVLVLRQRPRAASLGV
jgi:hypothetical protein